MPIRVHCPTGCLIRMPSNRAGKIVRCPECKATLELPQISDSELLSGKPIPLHAKLLETETESQSNLESKSKSKSDSDTETKTTNPENDIVKPEQPVIYPANAFVAESKFLELSEIDLAMERMSKLPAGPALPVEMPAPAEPSQVKPRMSVPPELSPIAIRNAAALQKAKLQRALASVKPIPEIKSTVREPQVTASRPEEIQLRRVNRPVVSAFEVTAIAAAEEPMDWRRRVEKANMDRIILARFFAICICVVAMVNVLPAIFHGYQWYHSVDSNALPRWIYLQIFVAALYFIYAIFLFQIPDWSAIRAVAIAMLVIAFVFGLCSTVLLIDVGQGWLATFLGLSFAIGQRAAIWCVAMLCLATLLAYWGGREAANWQRSEQLLAEILDLT